MAEESDPAGWRWSIVGLLIEELKKTPDEVQHSFSLRTALEYIEWLRGYRSQQNKAIQQTVSEGDETPQPVDNRQAKDAVKKHIPSIEIEVDLATLRKRAKTESWRFEAMRKRQTSDRPPS
jgi:hypothetical protein